MSKTHLGVLLSEARQMTMTSAGSHREHAILEQRINREE